MIEPTVGRVVWFTPPYEKDGPFNEPFFGFKPPFAAHVAYVHDRRYVNLMVIRPDGAGVVGFTSVGLLQDGEAPPPYGRYAEWMPYQKGQAAKSA